MQFLFPTFRQSSSKLCGVGLQFENHLFGIDGFGELKVNMIVFVGRNKVKNILVEITQENRVHAGGLDNEIVGMFLVAYLLMLGSNWFDEMNLRSTKCRMYPLAISLSKRDRRLDFVSVIDRIDHQEEKGTPANFAATCVT